MMDDLFPEARKPQAKARAELKVAEGQREQLLRALGIGGELHSAAESAGLTVEAVMGDPVLLGNAVDAMERANSRLRERMLEIALQQKSGPMLEKVLAQRAEAVAALRSKSAGSDAVLSLELRVRLLEALRLHPEALAAVVGVLEEFEDELEGRPRAVEHMTDAQALQEWRRLIKRPEQRL